MLYTIASSKNIGQLSRDLEEAVAEHKFGVLNMIDLKAKMVEKGVDFDRPCLIFEVCNPHQAKRVLDKNAAISTALPCRISLYQEGETLQLATIKPTAMMALYEDSGLQEVAREVEESLMRIMQQAAS